MSKEAAALWFRRRRLGGSAVGLKLASTADHALSSANWSETILFSMVRLKPDHDGTNTLAFLAGNGGGSGVHSFMASDYGGYPSSTRSRLTGFHGAYIDPIPNGIHIITDELVARPRYLTMAYRLIPGVQIELWIDAKMLWKASTALTSLGTAAGYGINRRPADTSYNFGAMTWVESQASTASLSDAEVVAAMTAAPGTPLPQSASTVHWLNAADCGQPGGAVPASIPDRISGKGTLAITSSGASIVSVGSGMPMVGPVEIIGDSKWGRRADGTWDSGTQRAAIKRIEQARVAPFVGQATFTYASTPLDFDAWHTCVGGMGLGATPGGGTTRLSTVAADRAAARGAVPSGITSIAMGVNDLLRLIDGLLQSVPTAVANLQGYFDSEVSGLRVVRTGPILIHTIPKVATASYSAGVRSAIDSFNAAIDSMVATLDSTYGDVSVFDEEEVFAAAYGSGYQDDGVSGPYYDGIHWKDAAKTIMGEAYADHLAARF